MENRKYLNWANALRAWCMVGVYLWHGEVFCGSHPFLSTYISPVCMAAFFFVSGFLFFRKYDVLTDGNFWRTEAENVFFRLAVPTMLFAALLYVPKVFFHQASPSLPDFMLAVFGGTAFWFTSSLVLIQLAAVRSALNNTAKIILKDHIEHCIAEADEGNEERLQELNDAIDKFI